MSPAVAVNAKLQYAVVEVRSLLPGDSSSPDKAKKKIGNVLLEQKKLFLVVALDLVKTLQDKFGVNLIVKKTFLGSELENCR